MVIGLPPGEEPRLYWNSLLGHFVGLRPGDITDLTPAQLLDAQKLADTLAKRGGR